MTEHLRQRTGDQPLPVPNGRPSAHDRLLELVAQRRQIGLDRYGSLLQPHNGRDTGRDLVEELADGAVYALTLADEAADLQEALLRLVRLWDTEPGEEKLAAMRVAFGSARALLAQRGAL